MEFPAFLLSKSNIGHMPRRRKTAKSRTAKRKILND